MKLDKIDKLGPSVFVAADVVSSWAALRDRSESAEAARFQRLIDGLANSVWANGLADPDRSYELFPAPPPPPRSSRKRRSK